MAQNAEAIKDSLTSSFGETPYPTLVNQIIHAADRAKGDVSTVESTIRTLLWQNYSFRRSAAVNTAVAALVALVIGLNSH